MEHVIDPYSIPREGLIFDDEEAEYPRLRWNLKQMRETHYEMWMMFGSRCSDSRWTADELQAINRKYCEDTGRWDLFNWE